MKVRLREPVILAVASLAVLAAVSVASAQVKPPAVPHSELGIDAGEAPRGVRSTITSIEPIGELVLNADLVVVASATQRVATIDTTVTLTLGVSRTLKGTAGPEITATWVAPDDPYVESLPLNTPGLWFLREYPKGQWAPLSLVGNSSWASDLMVAVPLGKLPPERAYQASDPAIDKVVQELWNALQSPDDGIADQAFAKTQELLTSRGFWSPFQHVSQMGAAHEAGCPTAHLAKVFDVMLVDRLETYVAHHGSETPPYGFNPPFGMLEALHYVRTAEVLESLNRLQASGLGGSRVQQAVARAVDRIRILTRE